MQKKFRKHVLLTVLADWLCDPFGILVVFVFVLFGTDQLVRLGFSPLTVSFMGLVLYFVATTTYTLDHLIRRNGLVSVRGGIRIDWYRTKLGGKNECLENTAGYIFGVDKLTRGAPEALTPVTKRVVLDLEAAFINTVLLTMNHRASGIEAQEVLFKKTAKIYAELQKLISTLESLKGQRRVGRIKDQTEGIYDRIKDIAQEARRAAKNSI